MENVLGPDVMDGLDDRTKLVVGLMHKMELGTYSTAFSGIDSPGTAFAQLRAFVSAYMDSPVIDPQHIHAIDSQCYGNPFCLFSFWSLFDFMALFWFTQSIPKSN